MENTGNLNRSNNSDEVSLKELVIKVHSAYWYLVSKWIIIAAVGFIGGAVGFAYTYFKRPVYTASTTFVLEEAREGGLGNLAGLASIAGLDLGAGGGGLFQGDNILALYKSRRMIEQTLFSRVSIEGKEQYLIDRYVEFNGLSEIWNNDLKSKNVKINSQPERIRDSIVGVIVADINDNYLSVAKPDKKLSIIKADVKSEDELFAKEFNDKIVENVNAFYVKTKTKKSMENVLILQQKADSVRVVMNSAIYSAAAVVDATPNLNHTRQLQRSAPMQRSQFSAEANKEMLGLLVQNLEMSKMSLRKETPLIQVIDQPVLPLVKERFGKVKGALIGGLITTFLCVVILLIRKILLDILR